MEDIRMDSSLALVRPHLPPALVEPSSLARIEAVAARLPRFAVDFFGFECRLAAGDAPTDCAINLTADGARMFAGRHAVPAPPELRGAPWDRLEGFYRAWGDTREQPYIDAGSTWLEFDVSAPAPMPNLLFGYWPEQRTIHRPLTWLADTILPMLLGEPMTELFRRNFLRAIEECPGTFGDFQVGVMFSRAVRAVRVCVFDLPKDEIVPYLDRIGWSGDANELLLWMERFAPHADFLGLHLDVGEKVYPHIGVEPNFTAGCWSRQPHKEPRWFGQFEMLEQYGLADRAKSAALMQWIGHSEMTIDDRDALLLRGLSHLKLVLRPGGAPIAKAYFGLAHRMLNAAAAAS